MPDYVIFEQATGRILRRIKVPEAFLAGSFDPAVEAYLEADAEPDHCYVADGAIAALPDAPGPWAVFDYAARCWIDPRTPDDLADAFPALKSAARAQLMAACAAFEAGFVTPLPAQAMKYARKEADARAFLAADDPDPADHPWIAAEVGITAPTAWEVAQVYVNLASLWTEVACRYEPIRLRAGASIDAAASPADLEAAVMTFSEAMQLLVAGLSAGPVSAEPEAAA